MAQAKTASGGEVVQAWVPLELASRLRSRAEDERRSVSAVIRLAVEDSLEAAGSREPERTA